MFGPEEPFLRYMGGYVAIMTIPNFLGLDHWQTFYLGGGDAGAGLIGLDGSGTARAYLGFESKEPVPYDYRDENAQKQLLAERSAELGWVVPQILAHMRDDASGFHFDARIQVIMEHWTKGRVALVGDAGYAVSLTTGQGASMAMVGAYILAGEIAASGADLTLWRHPLRGRDPGIRAAQPGGCAETQRPEPERRTVGPTPVTSPTSEPWSRTWP